MRYLLTFPILIFTLSNSLAEEALTLPRAIDMALEYNPYLEAFRQRVIAADGRRIDASKWSNPEVGVSVEEAPFDGGIGRGKVQGGVMQEIPFPGKKRLDRRIGKAGVNLSSRNLLSARVALMREVKIAYFETLAAERRHTIAGEIMLLTRSSSTAVTKSLAAGRGSVQDQLRAEIEAERAATELEDTHQKIMAARQNLAALLGDAAVAKNSVNGNLSQFVNADLIARVRQSGDADGVTGHPRIAAAQAAINRATLILKRQRLERLPNLTAGVEAGRDGSDDESIFGLSFSLPLPLINRNQGIIQEAGAELKIAQSELVGVKLALTTELRATFKRYLAASLQVEAYRDRILPKADEAVKLADKGFAEGRFTLTDLLDTQRTTASVHLIYQDKLLELLNSQADIEALMDDSGKSNLTESKN